VVVVWTPRSVESRWVRGEAREALERGILVPVRFENASLPIDVRAVHTTDLDDSPPGAESPQVSEVLRAVRSLIGTQSAASAVAIPARSSARRAHQVAICVLPFVNMSGDPEQEYFSDGITEDIITDLSKVSALSVTSRNSAFVYKGKHVDIPRVARELNVSYVLEGSVRKAGGRVRITAQLVDGASNDHVWAERYDRDLNDIFALQDEISEAIVKALKLKLLPAEKKAIEQRGTSNVEAYNLHLMARQLYVTGHEGDSRRLEAIVRLCIRTTEIDPNYAQAWALLAIAQCNLHFALRRAGDDGLGSAERALELDAGLPEAHAAKALILAQSDRHHEAGAEIDVALQLDPDCYEVNRAAAYLAYGQDRLQDAIRYFEKAAALMETDINSLTMLMSCYHNVADSEARLRASRLVLSRADKVLAQDPNNGNVLAYSACALASLREAERARERMNRALLIDPENWAMRYNFACVYMIHLDDPEAALDALAPVLENIAVGFVNHAKVDPDFRPLHDHPRFKAMIAAAEVRLAAARDPPAS
jgi:adenylate cyclase